MIMGAIGSRKPATIERFTEFGVIVRYGPLPRDIEWLTGITYPKMPIAVGDRGFLVYTSLSSSLSLWLWQPE